jgi:hypothetical protein
MWDQFINVPILRNPMNWVTIGAMIALVIMGGMVIYSRCNNSTTPPVNDGGSNLSKEA